MDIPRISIDKVPLLSINKFREMDYLATEKYKLPIELMMENAGLHLAQLAATYLSGKKPILIGIGPGNNGGGGLVAARRLAGWGYPVFLNVPVVKLKELPAIQLERALSFGVKLDKPENPQLFIDAYLGFSQRLPLPDYFMKAIRNANSFTCPKISLDLPTGFNGQTSTSLFKPDAILTLAAMKTELLPMLPTTRIYIADLGIPFSIYQKFQIAAETFQFAGIIEVCP